MTPKPKTCCHNCGAETTAEHAKRHWHWVRVGRFVNDGHMESGSRDVAACCDNCLVEIMGKGTAVSLRFS